MFFRRLAGVRWNFYSGSGSGVYSFPYKDTTMTSQSLGLYNDRDYRTEWRKLGRYVRINEPVSELPYHLRGRMTM
jgi:hypothetical protein